MNKLVFNGVEFGKKEFYEGKKALNLKEDEADKIVVNNKIKGNNETSKVFIGYILHDSVVPLCIIL